MLNQDFKEFIGSLNANAVRYLVVGGYAVAFHGYPRFTMDLDIWIKSTVENASKLIQALKDFGFGSLDLQVEDFLVPDTIIQLGYPPNRIDLITSPHGVEFENYDQNKVEEVVDGVVINFLSIEDLKKNKKATARHQDLADLENLE